MSADVNPAADGVDLADLADLILQVARRIQTLEVGDTGGVALTHLEAMVMSRIDDDPGTTPKALGAALGLRSSNTSAALRSLEEKKLISRIPDAADGRVTRLHPTPLAAANLAQVRETWRRALAPALGGGEGGGDDGTVAPGDVATTLEVLRHLSEELG